VGTERTLPRSHERRGVDEAGPETRSGAVDEAHRQGPAPVLCRREVREHIELAVDEVLRSRRRRVSAFACVALENRR